MSFRDEMLGRAQSATIEATERVGRQPVVDLLEKFGVSRVGFIITGSLPDYIDEVEALLPPPPKVPVQFKIGERVSLTHTSPSFGTDKVAPGTVFGFEVRYLVKLDSSLHVPVFGHRAERLKSLEAAPVHFSPAIHFDFGQE